LVERLQRVMDSSYIPVWLRRPVEAMDGRKPLDLLANGEFREVARIVSSLGGRYVHLTDQPSTFPHARASSRQGSTSQYLRAAPDVDGRIQTAAPPMRSD
jgi:hypothetical protein